MQKLSSDDIKDEIQALQSQIADEYKLTENRNEEELAITSKVMALKNRKTNLNRFAEAAPPKAMVALDERLENLREDVYILEDALEALNLMASAASDDENESHSSG